MTTLYELRGPLLEGIESGFIFDEETGEITCEWSSLDELAERFEDKVAACGIYCKNLESDIEAIKAEEERLKKRREVLAKKSERLMEYMLGGMRSAGIEKVERPQAVVSIRRNPASVDIIDQEALPAEYLREKVSVAPDKKSIKKALQEGLEVPGAALVYNSKVVVK